MRPLLPLFLFALLSHVGPAQKLQVYILAGQSNMQGHAKLETLDFMADDERSAPLLRRMRTRRGKPRVCDRVWISALGSGKQGESSTASGQLTAGWGARRNIARSDGKLGPEFAFGVTLSEQSKNPILIIKTAWGGKSLHTDFRPPSAGPYVFTKEALRGLAKRGKDIEAEKAKKREATGLYYRAMIDHVRVVLGRLDRVVPRRVARRGYELAGFVWFQGWNDMVDRGTYPRRDREGGYDEYSRCLAALIRDVRKDLGDKQLPFVIGVMGVGGEIAPDEAKKRAVHRHFRAAMAAPATLSEFRGNVAVVETARFWDPKLAEIDRKLQEVRQLTHRLRTRHRDSANKDGKMSPREQREYVARFRAKLLGKDEEVWKRGASNAAYHYFGCAKTLSLIGEAFASEVERLRKKRK